MPEIVRRSGVGSIMMVPLISWAASILCTALATLMYWWWWWWWWCSAGGEVGREVDLDAIRGYSAELGGAGRGEEDTVYVARAPVSRLGHVMRGARTCSGCPLRAMAMRRCAPTGGLWGCIQTVKPVASAVASWIAGAVVLIRSVPDMLSRIWRVTASSSLVSEGSPV
jgi:hypothetical protein